MLRLFHNSKTKKRKGVAGLSIPSPASSQTAAPLPTACEIRIQKDLSELDMPPGTCMVFPDPDSLFSFYLSIKPQDGFYKGGQFWFVFRMRETYPYDPPKVFCMQQIYHPNIDLNGRVCLNILIDEWTPVLSLNSIIYGLQNLFLEPNPHDPLNKEAALVLSTNSAQFQQNVKRAMRGETIQTHRYDCVLLSTAAPPRPTTAAALPPNK